MNNGTVNTPSQWQVNQGTFTNNNAFNGSLANTGTASHHRHLDGLGDQQHQRHVQQHRHDHRQRGQHGTFTNNGTIGGSFGNMGVLSGTGTIGGSLANGGMIAPGNSIGTLTVSGNFMHESGAARSRPRSTARARATASMSAARPTLQGGTVTS